MGGYARLKTAIERERGDSEEPCFLLDGGDEFQGSGPAAWFEGEAGLKPLNALGIDAFTPGNWEPVYGPERFKQTMARLDCPAPRKADLSSSGARVGPVPTSQWQPDRPLARTATAALTPAMWIIATESRRWSGALAEPIGQEISGGRQ